MTNKSELNALVEHYHNGRNIFLNGPAGTGKTSCIKKFVAMLDLDERVNYQILAPTGTAACNIQGITIQSYFHIVPVSGSNARMQIQRSLYQNDGLDLLFIDEISMVGDELFEVVDRILKKNYNSRKPFGGIQCIVCGDFYQLPPVKQKMCFEHKTWQRMNFVTIDFENQKRYTCERTFATLGRIRVGRLSQPDRKWLAERKRAYARKEHKLLPIKPVQLYSNRDNVAAINTSKLAKVDQPLIKFAAIDEINVPRNITLCTEKFLNELADPECELKVSIPIIFYRNYNIGETLTNGRSGIVAEINEEAKEVLVRLADGSEHIIVPKKYTTNGPGWSLSRTQFPIRAGWAMTIAKAQGSTLDYAIVDLNCPYAGQAYTAISRVTSIDNLFIKNINYKTIKADPNVNTYMNSLGW